MIELSNVSKIYDNDVTGVKELNLTIQDGEFVFLVGESGSGKSTLLKLLMKELDPTEERDHHRRRGRDASKEKKCISAPPQNGDRLSGLPPSHEKDCV